MSSSSIVLLVIYASLINVYNAYLQQSDMYPWGAGKFEDRQEDILEEMRRNLVLDVKKEIIPDHFLYPDPDDNDTPVYLSNSEGFHFLIQLETKNDTVSSGPPTNNNVLSEGITNRRILIKSLKGLCAFHNKEYWSFEWCHRREVRQAHIKFNEGKVVRDPDWSLGTYQTSTIEREGGNNQNKSAPIIKVSSEFIY